MADQPKSDKSTSPSRNKGGGGKKSGSDAKKRSSSKKEKSGSGFPKRENRSGSRRHHDRPLTGEEGAKRAERQATARKSEVAAQAQARDERQPKGWAGRRAARRGR